MRKLVFIAILAIGCNVNAQWKKDEKNKEDSIEDVAYFISEKDTIAKKWKDLYTGENFISATNNNNYLKVWKTNDTNYLSFFANEILSIEPNKTYQAVILFDDNIRIEKKGFTLSDPNEIEFILILTVKETEYLKAKKVKGIMIENDIIDSNKFKLDTLLLQKTANIVWPSKK